MAQKRTDSATQRETLSLIDEGKTTEKGKMDDDENFIVEEPVASGVDALLADGEAGADADELVAEDHGGLVRKILETKKELESGLGTDSVNEKPLIAYDEKERERTRKETGKLQEYVQQLTKNAHPLGRLVDYLQEDVDSMLKELEQWRAEYKQNITKLRQSQGTERTDLDPLKARLNELEQQTKERRDAIAALRGSILENESKLQNLVQAVGR